MGDDAGPSRSMWWKRFFWAAVTLFLLWYVTDGLRGLPYDGAHDDGHKVSAAAPAQVGGEVSEMGSPVTGMPSHVGLIGVAVAILLAFSAFFSGSETAFFSIHRLRLRTMSEENGGTGHMVAAMMNRPSRLLTTLLVGNMCVNILIATLLGTRVETFFSEMFGLQPGVAYVLAVVICTSVLLFFGEITPKLVAVRVGERFARIAVLPLLVIDKILSPPRNALLYVTNALFRITRFQELRAAPFITDDELKSALSASEEQGVIQEEERQMIQGILEFSDALLREILVPRPDVVALPEDATVAEALALFREHEYSRMPIYHDDLDHITGILVAKDLLPSVARGEMNRAVKTLGRPPHFVPETMTVQQYVNLTQRRRRHLAIVVDEYGGTEGIVTLEDAIEEVVGDIMDEDESELPEYEKVGDLVYRVDGGMSLDELNELIGTELEDEEHETVAGFFMDRTDKIPEPGDTVEQTGIRFTVETCEGRRVSSVRVELLPKADEEESAS